MSYKKEDVLERRKRNRKHPKKQYSKSVVIQIVRMAMWAAARWQLKTTKRSNEMKYAVILLLIIGTSIASAQSKKAPPVTFLGKSLTADSSHVPGVEQVFLDSAKVAYFRMLLQPQRDGTFLTETGSLLVPIPVQLLTQERLTYIQAAINLWVAQYQYDQAEKAKK